MENKNNIELRSKPIQELVGRIPPKILRFGIGIFFFCLIMMIIISNFIKYPEFIKVPMHIEKCNNQSKQFVAILKLPPDKINNISVDQEVFLKIEQFPENEFGLEKAILKKIEPNLSIDSNKNRFYKGKALIGEKLFRKNCEQIAIDDLFGIAEIKHENKSVFSKMFKISD